MERCRSGWTGRSRKAVNRKVPRVRIPLSPPHWKNCLMQDPNTHPQAPPEQPVAQSNDTAKPIMAMVFGIVSLTGPGFILGIPAIIIAIIALKRKLPGKGLSITGLVTGIISTLVSLLLVALFIFVIVLGANDPSFYDSQGPYAPESEGSQQERQRFESSQT